MSNEKTVKKVTNPPLRKGAVISRLSSEIKDSLFKLNEIACYHQDDKELQNSICRELRKIHNRVDKMSALNGL